MSSFYKAIALASHKHSTQLNAIISLASAGRDEWLNLNIEGHRGPYRLSESVTLSPEQAKKLRDALLEAYPVEVPVEAPAPAPAISSGTGTDFKVGDKVRVITSRHGPDQKDCEGVITAFSTEGTLPIWVDFTGRPKKSPVSRNCYAARDLALVTTSVETGRFIVSRLEGSTYMPGLKPVIHTTHAKASAEAQRLAKQVGGTFHVLRATFEATREKPVIPPVKTATL